MIFSAPRQVTSSKDKAILITGCDSGIGLAIAINLLTKHKFTVICCFLKDKRELLRKFVDKQATGRLLMLKLDITNKSDLENLKQKLDEWQQSKLFEHLWAVINNSGRLVYGEFDWLTQDQICQQVNVNILGTMSVTQVVLPYIVESKGRIINVSSVNDSICFPGTSVYSATKGAITTFSKALGFELRKFGCHVIIFRPGDYARLTNIMSKHLEDKEIMWHNMSEKKRSIYENYFEIFNNHLMENYGMSSPKSMQDSPLFDDIDKAILLEKPPSIITSAPIAYRFLYYICEYLPIWLQYILLDALIVIGFKWSSSKAQVKTS